mgnify:CR=1 FL=1
MTATIIIDPVAPSRSEPAGTVHALDTLAGKVVGFIDNAKPNFNLLADDLAELLMQRHGVAAVVRHRKHAASVAASAEMMDDLQQKCDLVITGSGD